MKNHIPLGLSELAERHHRFLRLDFQKSGIGTDAFSENGQTSPHYIIGTQLPSDLIRCLLCDGPGDILERLAHRLTVDNDDFATERQTGIKHIRDPFF